MRTRLGLVDKYPLLVEPVAHGTDQRLFDTHTALSIRPSDRWG